MEGNRDGKFPTPHHSAAALAAAISVVVFTVLMLALDDDCNSDGASGILKCVEFMPTRWWFYAVVALVATGYGVWCWLWRNIRRQETDEALSHSSLVYADREVVRDLRRRAFRTRARAGVFLASVVTSLFVGFYFSIYVSPHVRDNDRSIGAAIVEREYKSELEALESGQYWLLAHRVKDPGTSNESFQIGENRVLIGDTEKPEGSTKAYLFAYEIEGPIWDFGTKPRIFSLLSAPSARGGEVTAVQFGTEKTSMVGTRDGALYLAADGDAWKQLDRPPLGTDEWVAGGIVADSKLRLVVGQKGSVLLYDGRRWAAPKYWETVGAVEVAAAEFHEGGGSGVIGTKDGVLHSTMDGGKTWYATPQDALGLKDGEWVDGAVVAADGAHIVRGNEGSVRIRTERQSVRATIEHMWISPEGASASAGRRITTVKFPEGDGEAVIGTSDGSLHWRSGRSGPWTTERRGDLGLENGDWVTHAVIEEGKPWLVVSDKGSIKIRRKNEWIDFLRVTEGVTVVEFEESGQQGVIAARDGSLYRVEGGRLQEPESREALGLWDDEWVIYAVIKEGVPRLIVGDEGSIMTRNEGEWSAAFRVTTGITVVEFHEDCEQGLVGTRDGALHWTSDGGRTWHTEKEALRLDPGEWVHRAVVDGDGPRLIVGSDRSERVRIENEWVDLNSGEFEFVRVVAFDEDGRFGVIGTRDGALHWTEDGGESWNHSWTGHEIGLKPGEWVDEAVVTRDGVELVVGNKGAVILRTEKDGWISANIWNVVTSAKFRGDSQQHGLMETEDGARYVTTDGGMTWARILRNGVGETAADWTEGPKAVNRIEDFRTDRDGIAVRTQGGWNYPEWAVVTAAHRDGNSGLIATSDGGVHLTVDDGNTWIENVGDELGLGAAEWVVGAVMTGNRQWAIVGDQGAVRVGGEEWVRPPLPRSGADRVLYSGTSWDVLVGVVDVVDYYRVGESELILTDGLAWFWDYRAEKKKWGRLDAEFPDGERAVAIAFHEEDPVVVGERGTVLFGKARHDASGEFPEGVALGSVVIHHHDAETMIVRVRDDRADMFYYLGKHEVDNVRDLVDSLPEESRLGQRMKVALGVERNEFSHLERFGIDETFWMRFAVMAATVYLAQLLVRLYQYSIRLAAFWDSRADAILLGPNFSDSKPSFDSLMAAMGAELFEFRPPRIGHLHAWRSPPKDSS